MPSTILHYKSDVYQTLIIKFMAIIRQILKFYQQIIKRFFVKINRSIYGL